MGKKGSETEKKFQLQMYGGHKGDKTLLKKMSDLKSTLFGCQVNYRGEREIIH